MSTFYTNKRPRVLGLMSGTSLDGLDLTMCVFHEGLSAEFAVERALTVSYPDELRSDLLKAQNMSEKNLTTLSRRLGTFFGETINAHFSGQFLIASHGHTIFHDPHNMSTLQIGDPRTIQKLTGKDVVANFREADVQQGGQGAPLVPIGDRDLFSEYNACLNLGGFANISFQKEGKRIAFDVCPVNFCLNRLSEKLGLAYDDEGRIAASGQVVVPMLNKLNLIPFYALAPPKSMGREWVEKYVWPIFDEFELNLADTMRTYVEHIAIQLATVIPPGKCLVTGGGAWNNFLVKRSQELTRATLIVPPAELVNFKEALIFAYLGWLKWHGKINVLSSVTGGNADLSAGDIYRSVDNAR